MHARPGLVIAAILLATTAAGGGAAAAASALSTARSAAPVAAAAATIPNPTTVFRGIAPCRVADTRLGGGALADGSVRSFRVRGTSGFAAQGGAGSGCGIPSFATSVTANVTVVGAKTSGYLIGYPAGTTAPLTNFVTVTAGQTTTVNPTFALASTGEPSLSMKNHGSPVQVVIDVTGYYVPQIQAAVAGNGALVVASPQVVSSVRNGPGDYTVTLAAGAGACLTAVDASDYSTSTVYGFAQSSGNQVSVHTWTLDASTHLDVPADANLELLITC